jgi:hypothetical protein
LQNWGALLSWNLFSIIPLKFILRGRMLDIYEKLSTQEPPFNFPKFEVFLHLTFYFTDPKSISMLNFLLLRFNVEILNGVVMSFRNFESSPAY